jgi:hypothetical protein
MHGMHSTECFFLKRVYCSIDFGFDRIGKTKEGRKKRRVLKFKEQATFVNLLFKLS